MNSFLLEEESQALCQERLESMVDDNYVISAVLSTPDGKLVASARQDTTVTGHDVARMSQMVMSLAAEEVSPRRNRIICDLKGRPMVILHAGPLLLTILGKMDANMGMIANIAEHSASEMRPAIRMAEKSGSGQFAFDADGFTEKVLADLKKRNPEKPM